MLKFRYLLIVFLFNFFLKSAYSQSACQENSDNTINYCTGPLNVTSNGTAITNSGTISLTSQGQTAYALNLTGNYATITNSGTISRTSPSDNAYALNLTGNNAKITNTNTGTITVTSSGAYGIYGASGSSNLTVENSGTISSISGVADWGPTLLQALILISGLQIQEQLQQQL